MPSEREYKKDPNELGALWFNDKGGEKDYMSGTVTIDGVVTKIVCFRVKSKKPKAPHWRILRSVPREERESTRDEFRGGYEPDPDPGDAPPF